MKRSIFLIFIRVVHVQLMAQSLTVNGVVLDESSQAVIGATVLEEEPKTEPLPIWMANLPCK